ncbi:Interleukin-1 receptor-associated kinase 1 [Tulasnella sp. JGI-2019a]|nr:Interleukin-1 receptor-associated kinase 1 [Tulasnella sp. JGI-2019a]
MRDAQAVVALIEGVLPESEELLTHPVNIWPIVQGCWHIEPGLRSIAETSARRLRLLIQQDTGRLDAAMANLKRYRIPLEHLEIDQSFKIGRGGFGVVIRAKMLGYHSEVAVKRLKSDKTRYICVAKRLVRELKTWSTLKHPNILPLIGFYLSKGRDVALIVCPLLPHGNVKDYLQRFKPSVPERLQFALDTIFAVDYLHNLDPLVIHGDIKGVRIDCTGCGAFVC